MTSVLKIVFNLPGGRSMSWSLADPKTGLTQAEVETLCNDLITQSMLLVNSVEPESFKEAYIYQTQKLDLA